MCCRYFLKLLKFHQLIRIACHQLITSFPRPSLESQKILALFTYICHNLYIIPFRWNPRFECPQIDPERRSFYWRTFVAQFAIILVYEMFLLYRGFQQLGKPLKSAIKILFSIAAYVTLNVNQILILWHWDLYSYFLCNYSKLLTRFQGTTVVRAVDWQSKKLQLILVCISIASVSPAFTRAMDAIFNPAFPALITSLFPDPAEVPAIIKFVAFCIHFTLNTFHYCMLTFNLVCTVTCSFGMAKMSQVLQVDSKECTMLSADKIRRLFRQMYMLQNIQNGMFGSFMFTLEILGVLASVLNLFFAVTESNLKLFIVGVMILIAFIPCYGTFADVHAVSVVTVRSWKAVESPPWFRKFVRSVKPPRVTVGSYYFVDRKLLLTFLSIVCNYTTNLVVTYNS